VDESDESLIFPMGFVELRHDRTAATSTQRLVPLAPD